MLKHRPRLSGQENFSKAVDYMLKLARIHAVPQDGRSI